MVFDSDKSADLDEIDSSKKRLAREFSDSELIEWMTQGRTIENYLPETHLKTAIKEVHPAYIGSTKWSQYEDLTKMTHSKTQEDKRINKVKVARKLTELFPEPDFAHLDLEKRIKEIASDILQKNGLDVSSTTANEPGGL